MPLHDSPANGQTDAGARVAFSRVQPLEHLKNASEVLRLDADPIVLHGEDPMISVKSSGNVNFRAVCIAVFDRVANQVLQ